MPAAAKPPGAATGSTGVLDGKLTDWHSVPLGEAAVTVRNLTTGETLHGVTAKNGSYRFAGLGPGEYRLEADVPQLGRGAVEEIVISAGHATRVQAALMMEAPKLPIRSEAGELDPVTPAVATMIPAEELNALPAATRSWEQFAATTPAGNPVPQGAGGGGQLDGQGGPGSAYGSGFGSEADAQSEAFSMSTTVPLQTTTSIDGLPATPSFRGGAAGHAREGESLGESAVAEMQTRTGDAPAGEGRSPGAALSLTTAHGGNGLHGQAFYLNRQNLWGAKNPFTQWIEETSPAAGVDTAQFAGQAYSPSDSRQTFGVGVGGRIKRGKLFWFAALDGLLKNDPAVATVRHAAEFFAQPTLDELTVYASRLNLAGPDLLENAAASYSGWLTGLDGLLGPTPRTSNQWQGFARIDWQATERQHLSTEASGATMDAPHGGLTRTSETYGSHSFGNRSANEAWGLMRLESFLTANLLNGAEAEVRRQVERDSPQSPSAFETPLLVNAFGQLPEMVADSTNGFILGVPARQGNGVYPAERSLVVEDTLSWAHGAHLVRAGASFDHIADVTGVLANQTGTYSYADALNFISDTASFLQYGIGGVENPAGTYHNCDATGRVYNRGGQGNLGGLGDLPCYAWYSQRIGPSRWNVSSNDLALFATEQWQPAHNLTVSAGLRAETQQLPPPIGLVRNAGLPATEKLPAGMWNWGPRFGLAYAPFAGTVLRLGAGLYFGRIDNAVLLGALTQTGSPYSDLNFFFKPTDVGAPPFPYVFPVEPEAAVAPGAVSFAAGFRNQEVDQAVLGVEQSLPGGWLVSVSGLASLGRRLPVSIDTNLAPAVDASGVKQTITYAVEDSLRAGPIKTTTLTVPLYTGRVNPSYQQLSSIESRANSTYDAAMVKVTHSAGRGLSLRAHYLYAHAMDWNPNESAEVAGNDILDPARFGLEYGTSNLDIRHSAGATVLYRTPWQVRDWAGELANGWSVAAVGQYRSGLPFTMRTGGSIPGFYTTAGDLIEGVGPGINGSGGDNRIYGVGPSGAVFSIGRNTYRYPATWTADARVAKRFDLSGNRQIEVLAETFNLFNHQNVTLLETTGYTIRRGDAVGDPPTLNFLTGLTSTGAVSTTPEFGKPLDINATNFYHPREFQLGLRTRF